MGIARSSWLLFLFILLTGCVNDDDAGGSRGSMVSVGDEVPAFTLTSNVAEEVSSASLRGQVYMLTFFDTACPDCRKELPVLQRVYDKYAGTVSVFNVPRSQAVAEVQAYWSQESLTMPFHTASDSGLYYKFASSGIPRTYIVDGEGRVQAVLTDNPLADYATIDSLLCSILKTSTCRKECTVNVLFRMKRAESPHSSLLTANVPATDYFQNEYVVSRLELFVFDAETGKLVTRTVDENLIQEMSDLDSSYDITYMVPSKRINVGLFNIFAIANYPYTPEDIEDQDDFLSMIDSITYHSGIEPNIPSTGPVMTSSTTALLAVDLVPWADKSYSLMIEMERVLAKLQVGVAQHSFELTYEGEKYADVNITNYKLVNLNRKYFLFQQSDDDYILDPLFYEKTTSTAVASRFKDYYASWFGDFTTEGFASMPTAGNYGYAYILENTARKECQKNGYSTGIVFKGAVSPVLVYIYDNERRTLIAEKRPEYWPDAIYLYKYNFYGSIQAVNVAGNLGLDELEQYTDSQLKAYGIKQCRFNMGVYETYYTYWIQHRHDTSLHMEPMEYAIVRNNFYKITVAGVSGIGDSRVVPDIMRDNYPNSYADIEVRSDE